MTNESISIDKRFEARKEAEKIDKKLGVKQRVFSLRIIRPFNETIEDEYRKFRENLNVQFKDIKEKIREAKESHNFSKENELKNKLKKYEKERKKKIQEFFNKKKEENPELISLNELMSGLRKGFDISRTIYNKAVSKGFVQLMNKEKLDSYKNVIESAKELGYGDLPSDFIIGLTKKINSGFRIKDVLAGKRVIPEAKSNYPIPFYLAQGGETKKNSLIDFFVYSNKTGKLLLDESNTKIEKIDDFILEFKAPMIENNKVILRKVKVLCSTQKRKRNFKRNRDDATNKLIMDYLSGNIKDIIEKRLDSFVSKGIITTEQKDVLIRKYTQIPQYEILSKPVRFKNTEDYFISINVKDVPEIIPEECKTNNNMIAGIDFCFSKEKILYMTIMNIAERETENQKIEKWQKDTFPVFDKDYNLRKIYDDYYNERRKMQRKLSKKIENNEYEYKFNLRFANRRKYIMRLIVSHIAKKLIKHNVSVVYAENLDSLRNREDWFTINKIRNFPRATLINMLKMKLEQSGIELKEVSPVDTSKKCSLCGTKNNGFDFNYRKSNNFPLFECINEKCRFSKDSGKITNFEKWARDADQNAARNIILRGIGKV